MRTQTFLFAFAAAGFVSAASAQTANLGITLNTQTTMSGATPSNFAGMFTSSNIGHGVFDNDSSNPYFAHLQNLVSQMGVRHWRVEGGSATESENDNFFAFLQNTGCPQHSVEWGLLVYNVDALFPNGTNQNVTNAQMLLGDSLAAGFIDAFNFGNESDWQINVQKDQYIQNTGNPGSGFNANNPSPFSYSQPDAGWKVLAKSSSCSTVNQTQTPDPTGNPGGFKARWEWARGTISPLIPGGSPIGFAGPDTGDIASVGNANTEYNGTDDFGNPAIGTGLGTPSGSPTSWTPWTLQFAEDEKSNVKQITQHLYVVNGDNGKYTPPTWVGNGAPYCPGDEVLDPNETDSKNGALLYRCKTACYSYTSPEKSSYWTAMEPLWSAGPYGLGAVVRDAQNGDTLYQCVRAGSSSVHPSADTSQMWVTGSRAYYAFPGAHQLAIMATDPERIQDWQTAISQELTGNSNWPASLGFRMSEFSPFSGPKAGLFSGYYSDGKTPACDVVVGTPANTNCFASALLGLEMWHWWAKKGAAGVDPISNTTQTNSPLFSPPWGQSGGDYIAEPYAYVWPAFAQSALPGSGQEMWLTPASNPGIGISNPSGANVTAYAVLSSSGSDLIVTLFNKTFNYNTSEPAGTQATGAVTMSVAITMANVTNNFAPSSVRYMALNSGGTAGDSTALGCKLGSQTMSNTSPTFTPAWTSATWNGSSGVTITVPAFSAVIVDLQK